MNQETLHAYLDGELNPDEREAVERALAQDPALADAYARLVTLDEAIGISDTSADADVVVSDSVSDTSADADVVMSGGGVAGADEVGSREWVRGIVASERRARRGRLVALSTAVAGIAAAILLAFLPTVNPRSSDDGFFTVDEEASYVYWETDGETYGTGDLVELEDQILDVLGET